jgi:hypothetical protein
LTPNRRPVSQRPSAERKQASNLKALKDPLLIWTLKDLKGRVAAGTDVHQRALIMKAATLEETGRGGGVVGLLRAESDTDRRRLEKDRVVYHLRQVRQRDGGERAETREPEMIRAFLVKALEIKGWIPPAWKAKGLLDWIVTQMGDKSSPVYKMAAREFPLLVEHDPPRGLRWWQARWTDLGKMSR